MGRKPRIEYHGGVYHAIQRGNNHDYIYKDDSDKLWLINVLKSFREELGYKLFGYVIMDNHYHLIIQTNNYPLQTIMHRLNTRYSKYYNQKYVRVGHVFGDRYKALPVGDQSYILTLLRYIHQNPVRAGINKVSEYRWSSDYLYRKNLDDWVDIGIVLDGISANRAVAIKVYNELMTEYLAPDIPRITK